MAERILRLPKVLEVCGGIGRSTLYGWMNAGTFPKPIKLGVRAVGWAETEIDAWLESRKADREAV